jgi:acetylglutamate kinase
LSTKGDLLNVNADVLAGLAAVLGARRLIVAGATKGVLAKTAGRSLT